MNSVNLIGRLTAKPELRYTPAGKAVCDLRLAVNVRSKDKEETLFVAVTVWEKTAENCAQFLDKGRQIGVSGSLRLEQWEKDGEKRSIIKVVAHAVEFIGKGKEEGSAPATPGPRPKQHEMTAQSEPFPDDIGGDEIPF